jgi:hypothetical protein
MGVQSDGRRAANYQHILTTDEVPKAQVSAVLQEREAMRKVTRITKSGGYREFGFGELGCEEGLE